MKLLLILLSFIFAYSECTPQRVNFHKESIKKVTEVMFEYNADGSIGRDTLQTFYDTNGVEMFPDDKGGFSEGAIVSIDSVKKVDSSGNKAYFKLYYSNGEQASIDRTYSKDSIISYLIPADSVEKQVDILKHGKITRTIVYEIADSKCYLASIQIVNKNILFAPQNASKIWKYRYNRLTQKMRLYCFNDSTKTWFLSVRERYNQKGQLMKTAKWYYNSYLKKYYGDNERYYYDKDGNLVHTIKKDRQLRTTEEKTFYKYVFY